LASAGEAEEAEDGTTRRKSKNPRWLPLESNPAILNGFFDKVGISAAGPERLQFVDVLGLDDELLAFVPRPVVAVCLLFPSKPVSKSRREAMSERAEPRPAPPSTFYLVQHKEFGNACGTIAAVHAAGNLARSGVLQAAPGGRFEHFLDGTLGKSPEEIGWALADAEELHEASEAAAKSRQAQTRTPGRNDKVDCHFVVFVPVQGRLVELDGCMGQPIDHGPIAGDSLLKDTAKVIREEFMARAPGNPNFSVMALAGEEAQMPCDFGAVAGGAGGADPNADSIAALVSMGFEESAAREALVAVGGDVDQAVGLLCG